MILLIKEKVLRSDIRKYFSDFDGNHLSVRDIQLFLVDKFEASRKVSFFGTRPISMTLLWSGVKATKNEALNVLGLRVSSESLLV